MHSFGNNFPRMSIKNMRINGGVVFLVFGLLSTISGVSSQTLLKSHLEVKGVNNKSRKFEM